MKPRYKIDYCGLEQYLSKINRLDIETTWQNPGNPLLVEGLLQIDAESFEPVREIGIAYGEPFLCDLLGNDLSIGVHTRRRYKLPNGRAVNCIFDRTIIADCRCQYGNPLNGVWQIPSQFLTNIL